MSRRDLYLKAMGLTPLWRARQKGMSAASPSHHTPNPAMAPRKPISPPSPAAVQDPQQRQQRIANLGWEELVHEISQCRACDLCQQRTRTVPGIGDRQGPWLFVGEGPGADEDVKGEPFVGQAGKLLDQMLLSIGLQRGAGVFIANVVKCRPPGNRTPTPGEAMTCFPFLERQIALIRPQLIVALGRPAATTLLGGEVKIADVRGKVLRYRDIPLIVTYHPAYLLRNLPEKHKAWEDLCAIQSQMRGAS